MARRFDLSDKLIHFTSGESPDHAFARLLSIIGERRLIGGKQMIRGGYKCVCFTEAPLEAFTGAFVSRVPFTRYSQFGVMFDKSWLYEWGGRPVIYEPEPDFFLLPEELRWRHVRFDLTPEQVVDFTWEREWRLRCDELPFSPSEATIIVPDERWTDALYSTHNADQDYLVEQYSLVIERDIAECLRTPFRWHVMPLQRSTATSCHDGTSRRTQSSQDEQTSVRGRISDVFKLAPVLRSLR